MFVEVVKMLIKRQLKSSREPYSSLDSSVAIGVDKVTTHAVNDEGSEERKTQGMKR